MTLRVCNRRGCTTVLPAGRINPRCTNCQRDAMAKTIKRQGKSYTTRRRLKALDRRRANPQLYRDYAKTSRQKLRDEFIVAYGSRCTCCSEREPAFLTLEHLKRDGSQHRKQYPTSSQVLADLRRRGWPKDDYTLLCFNCNRARWQFGECPHRSSR